MLSKKQENQISKFLSLVLRHKPETIALSLNEEGWAETTLLLEKINEYGIKVSLEALQLIVANNDKKRFAFNDDHSMIRASQGHSIKVELNYERKVPPEFLYHGTAIRNMESIQEKGLEKRNRHHVHLSTNKSTALAVGQRYGKATLLAIESRRMHEDGLSFFQSENNVWLTEHVPPAYLNKISYETNSK